MSSWTGRCSTVAAATAASAYFRAPGSHSASSPMRASIGARPPALLQRENVDPGAHDRHVLLAVASQVSQGRRVAAGFEHRLPQDLAGARIERAETFIDGRADE